MWELSCKGSRELVLFVQPVRLQNSREKDNNFQRGCFSLKRHSGGSVPEWGASEKSGLSIHSFWWKVLGSVALGEAVSGWRRWMSVGQEREMG